MMPPRSILAAVDFSGPSGVALEFAARLANQSHASLHVLHVEDPLLHAAASKEGLDLTREIREELAQFTARSPAARERVPLHLHVVHGEAAKTVCDIARREQADLIVIGMHGMSGATHALFGSTTEGILHHADTPVFVIPDAWTPPRPETRDLTGTGPVIAAIECACSALAGVAAAARLAEILGTSLTALHVVRDLTVLDRWRGHAKTVVAQQMATARSEIGAALAGLKTSLAIPLQIESGSIPDRIAAATSRTNGQHPIVVLGRHVRGSRRGAPGATAYRVLERVRVPVLVYCLAED